VDEASKLKAAQAEEAQVLAAAPGMDAFDQLKKMAAEGGCCGCASRCCYWVLVGAVEGSVGASCQHRAALCRRMG
jgi:hypothetical protein